MYYAACLASTSFVTLAAMFLANLAGHNKNANAFWLAHRQDPVAVTRHHPGYARLFR